MKVGDLVRNHVNKKIGIIVEVSDAKWYNNKGRAVIWVRWVGNVDWDLHWTEDLDVLNESR